MKVIDPGHIYQPRFIDGENDGSWLIKFVKREGTKYPGNFGFYPGTTTQEVLRVLIDRSKYVNNQQRSFWTWLGIWFMRLTIFVFEIRAKRVKRKWLYPLAFIRIEEYHTCPTCGHILCTETHK